MMGKGQLIRAVGQMRRCGRPAEPYRQLVAAAMARDVLVRAFVAALDQFRGQAYACSTWCANRTASAPSPTAPATRFVAAADVARGEDARPDRLEQLGLPVAERPPVRSLASRGGLAALDVAGLVEVEHQVHRLGARLGADHHEHGRSRDAVSAPVVAVAQVGVLEAAVPVHGADLRRVMTSTLERDSMRSTR
jgi:hypothetical protein